jgi:hypothetical protein
MFIIHESSVGEYENTTFQMHIFGLCVYCYCTAYLVACPTGGNHTTYRLGECGGHIPLIIILSYRILCDVSCYSVLLRKGLDYIVMRRVWKVESEYVSRECELMF